MQLLLHRMRTKMRRNMMSLLRSASVARCAPSARANYRANPRQSRFDSTASCRFRPFGVCIVTPPPPPPLLLRHHQTLQHSAAKLDYRLQS